MRALVAVAVFALACSPYERRSGEYFAGAVDPAAFPAAYLGAGGDPKRSGGVLLASAATAHTDPAPYYAFAVSAAQAASDDPLAVSTDNNPTAIPAPLAYVFDPRLPAAVDMAGGVDLGAVDMAGAPAAAPPDPFPATPQCTPPSGYVYDARRDGYRLDDQGNVFTALPASGYAPIVAEVPVTSNGEACQSIKSSATLVTASDVVVDTVPPKFPIPNAKPTGVPDGRFLAWAIVDPGAEVRFPDGHLDPASGLGPQKLGWFDHYLLTYLDGGYVPTASVVVPGMAGNPDTIVVHIVAQNVYFPTAIPVTLPSGVVVPRSGKLGSGFDILDARRGEPGYSPLCHVFSFVPPDPLRPPTNAADIDASQLHDTGTFVWCLQVQP
ncbi:MAG: hypothetical protein ACXVAN_09630 [Polyangia bacterium]